ncbi:MAG: hypothetical protein QG632_713 [Candidatus Dependentiae bacterium]|nr:hypothetical protein [Candidatus Dependentiae bacterium]
MKWRSWLVVMMLGFHLGVFAATENPYKESYNSSAEYKIGFFSHYKGAIVATAVSVLVATAFFVANRIAIMQERAAREKALAALRGQYADAIAITLSLQARFDALPINDFMRQADAKIAQMQQMLATDAAQYQASLAQMRIELQYEVDRLSKELADRHLYLENVRLLLESIRDNNNFTFLTTLIDLKMEVEMALAQLAQDKMALSGHLAELTARTHDLHLHMTRNHAAINQMDDEVENLKKQTVVYREQADANQRYMRRVVEEIAAAKHGVLASQQEFSALNLDLKEKLRSMEGLARESKEQKNSVEAQIDQARRILAEVRHRVVQLDTIAGQEERRVQELVQKVEQAHALIDSGVPYSSVVVPKDASSNGYRPSADRTTNRQDASPVARAVAVLQEMLTPFSVNALTSAALYRKAYLRFCMKNHTDKGGDKQLFQAVDGLYKIILDHNLFDAPAIFISGHVEALLKQYAGQCLQYKGRMKK